MKIRTMTLVLAVASAAAVMLSPQPALATEAKAAEEGSTATVVVQDRSGRSTTTGSPGGLTVLAPRGGRPTGPGGLVSCPAGYHLSPFEMPIYDDDGLFVIGYETVWLCIPDDLEPAG
jgi:hypothetical protein